MASQTKITDLSDDKSATPSKPKSSSSSKRTPAPRTSKAESELRDRLTALFDRISESLEARGDTELATIIDEDAEVMAQGLVSLTRPFQPMRAIVLVLVSVIEPLMSFGRIFRVLVGRFAERRMRAQEQAEMAREEGGGYPPPTDAVDD